MVVHPSGVALSIHEQAAVAVVIALVLDLLVGELPERIHPVALFGRVIAGLDREWSSPRLAGMAIAVVAPLCCGVLAAAIVSSVAAVDPFAAALVAGVGLFTTLSLRRLLGAAREVLDAVGTGPERARDALSALVGRDPSTLSPGQVRSAAVESLAENLADGFVAPLVAFALGSQVSLSVGLAAAVWVKAINTLDSMLGYHSKPVGWASARLDDLVMWVPARLTAVLIAAAAVDPGALRRARRWQDEPPSPNSGWPMATLAAVLDVRLEKPGAYVLAPTASLPDGPTAARALRIVGVAGGLAGLAALASASIRVVPIATAPALPGVIAC